MDDFELLDVSEKEIKDYFVGDAFSLYLKEVFSCPINSIDENKKLARMYKNGDNTARDRMIKGNLRLVVNVAYKYRDKISHLQLLDIVQEGNLGLIRAIENYDPDIGAFSTYAIWWIKQAIMRSIVDKDEEIRKPAHFDEKKKKYFKLVSEYTKLGETIPSDEEFCQMLDISMNVLKQIQQNVGYVESINRKIDDDESTELGDFLSVPDDSYENVENKIVQHQLFVILKKILKPLEYYILYNRILSSNRMTLEEIAVKFNVSRERIRQIEVKVLKKVKPYLMENSKKCREIYSKILSAEKGFYDKLNTMPIDPDKIVIYLYIKDSLSDDERRVLQFLFFGKYNFNDIELCRYLGFEYDEYKRIFLSIKYKIDYFVSDSNKFRTFKNYILKNNGTAIFSLDLESTVHFIDYEFLKEKYSNLSLDEINQRINEYGDSFNNDEIYLLNRFFRKRTANNVSLFCLMRDINLSIFGLNTNNCGVNKSKLYKVYQKNIESFSEEQSLFLECYYFGVRPKNEFDTHYSDSSLYYRYYYLIDRLERIYYNIYSYFENSFTLSEYKKFRKKYINSFSEKRIELLDLFYGFSGRAYSIFELAEMYKIDYIKMHDAISDARESAIILYCGFSNRLDIDKRKYIPYVKNRIYEFTEETRTALTMFLIEDKDYDEISNLLGISKYRLSNIITDGIRKIDNYRFGLSNVFVISKRELKDFFDYYGDKISSIEKKVIKLKHLEYKSNKEISDLLGIEIAVINKISRRFNLLYYSFQIKDVNVSDDDIFVEVLKHPSESILSEKEKEFASFYYGFKTGYNVESKKYSILEICSKLGLTKNTYYHIYQEIINNVKGIKIGIKKVPNLYISRNELSLIINDCHLPISEKEKDIICYMFELNGYPYKNLDDLSTLLGDNKGSLTRRYNRAIVSIYKYLNKEIDGKIDYYNDILPNMRYFSLTDRKLIDAYFKDGCTVQELAERYNFSFDKMYTIIARLKIYLFDLLNNPNAKKFDFDYYLEVRYNVDLPFYGNRDIAIKIFDLFYGMVGDYRLSIPEIIDYLGLSLNPSAVNKAANNLMLCICKYREGIKNNIPFSDDDILSYYKIHCNEMDPQHKLYYLRYFSRRKNNRRINGVSNHINKTILYDLLLENNDNVLSFEDLDRNKVYDLLRKYSKILSDSTKNALMAIFDISDRELMSGKDINHVYKILDKLYRLEYKDNISCLLLKKD